MDGASVTSAPAHGSRQHNLFQVFLRLRPAPPSSSPSPPDRFLAVEEPERSHAAPTHITLNPPNDRRRAVEKFAFTQVLEEDATQLDTFHCTGVAPLVEGILAPQGGDGTDALLATLGVTGSGKSHTILGSKSQRGLTQLSLDLVFRSVGRSIVDCASDPTLEASIHASDASEAAVYSASAFLDSVYADPSASHGGSRAPTPMIVGSPVSTSTASLLPPSKTHDATRLRRPVAWENATPTRLPGSVDSPKTVRAKHSSPPAKTRLRQDARLQPGTLRGQFASTASSARKINNTKTNTEQGDAAGRPGTPSLRRPLNRPSPQPQQPDISSLTVACDAGAEYAVVLSMYEVYNDRIFDLLSPPVSGKPGAPAAAAANKDHVRRRPLLFKSTEASPDRKVVAGLRKVVCGTLHQALLVLDAGLHERRVAGTGSNSVSSRSHGFVCVEVRKRTRAGWRRTPAQSGWGGSALTIVDLAGSERARDAKTAGTTLAEAGKINESLMYLGQCLQMQSGAAGKERPHLVPFRQCKLTELLFSNSFPPPSSYSQSTSARRNPQKAVMIVTADPHGDFNATSQILRYSALAREVTVPRIPSITQTMLAGAATTGHANKATPGSPPLHHRPFSPPTDESHRSTMELAALEIARLSEEADYLGQALQTEQSLRMEVEAHLLSMEDRMLELEQAIREDCAAEFERRLEIETARWRASMQLETERGEEHWDRKIEVFERTITGESGSDDDGDKENVLVEDAAEENERLRMENEILRRELAAMSPSKRAPLRERGSDAALGSSQKARGAAVETGSPKPGRTRRTGGGAGSSLGLDGTGGLQRRMERLRVDDGEPRSSPTGSPKKVRKLPARRWDVAEDDF